MNAYEIVWKVCLKWFWEIIKMFMHFIFFLFFVYVCLNFCLSIFCSSLSRYLSHLPSKLILSWILSCYWHIYLLQPFVIDISLKLTIPFKGNLKRKKNEHLTNSCINAYSNAEKILLWLFEGKKSYRRRTKYQYRLTHFNRILRNRFRKL